MKFNRIFLWIFILSFLIAYLPQNVVQAQDQSISINNIAADHANSTMPFSESNKRTKELVDKRTANSKHFLMADGSEQAVITIEQQHFKDQNGLWQDIVPMLIDEADIQDTDGLISSEIVEDVKKIRNKNKEFMRQNRLNRNETSYRALQVPYNISLSKNFQQGYWIEKGEDRLSLKPIGASSKAKAEVVDKQTLKYSDVWTSTDVTLKILNNEVKETLILKNNSTPKNFSFEVKGKLNSELKSDQLMILPASLKDANGTVRDVKQIIRQEGNKQYIELSIDDSELIYPIEVDPSVKTISASTLAYRIAYPFGSSNLNSSSSYFYCGGKAYQFGYIDYMKFDLSSIYGDVQRATLTLNRVNTGFGDNESLLIRSYLISSSWSMSDPSNIPGQGGYISSDNTPGYNVPAVFSGMEKYVNNVLEGNPNNGIMLLPEFPQTTILRYFYSPQLTITYIPKPKISEVVAPSENQYFGPNDSSFIPIVKVSGPDASQLTTAYYIDNESKPRETKIVSNPQTAQTVSFSAMNIGALAEGKHTFKYTVTDGQVAAQQTVDVYIDKTAPVPGTVSVTSADSIVTVSGSASDSSSGLDAAPYRFTIGGVTSDWTSQKTYSRTDLIPNKQYAAKFEARDKVGLIASKEQQIYTKAQSPSLKVNRSMETSLDLSINDENPAGTKYVIQSGSKYVNAMGALTTTPVWFSPVNKKITVIGLTVNSLYSFVAKARNEPGIETAFGVAVSGTTLAAPPGDITFKLEQKAITLSWSAVTGAVGYDVEVDGVVNHNSLSATFLHSGLLPNTTHHYRIRVINTGGVGNWGPLIARSTLPNPPPIPTNVQAEPTQTDITVTWDTVAGSTGYDVEADGVVVDNGSSTTYVHKGLIPLTDHAYRIRAKNAGGISEWSNSVARSTLPFPPKTPENVAAQLDVHQITITWDPADGTDHYELEADGAILDNGNSTTYVHLGLDPLSGHTYRIRAVNAGGKGPWSIPLDVTTHPEKPEIPTNIMVTADETEITLTWYKVLNAESYEIEVDGITAVTVTGTQFIHSGLEQESKHSYRIRAVNISGKSEWSSPVTMMTLPSKNDINIALTNIAAVVTNSSITLSWDAVAPDAEYDVEADGIMTDNGDNTLFQQTGLPPNEFHTYKIKVKQDGIPGDWVAVLKLSTLPNPPDAPSSLDATATYNSIELKWERINGASGYDVEIDGKAISIGDVSYYLDQNLAPGTTHTYRLRAKNATDVTAWSPALVKSTIIPDYLIEAANGQSVDFTLLASSVQDFSERSFIVTYNPDELEVVDLCKYTLEKDTISSGNIYGTNLIATYVPGRIEFHMNQSVAPGTAWSGELTTILFKSRINGQTSIHFEMH